MLTRRAQIPIVPTESMRVAVKVDKSVYQLAKKLNIDVHSLWRMSLRNAVDIMNLAGAQDGNINPDHDSRNRNADPDTQDFNRLVDGLRLERRNGDGFNGQDPTGAEKGSEPLR